MKKTSGEGLLERAERIRDDESAVGIAIKTESLPHPETAFEASPVPYPLEDDLSPRADGRGEYPPPPPPPRGLGRGFLWLLGLNTLILVLVGLGLVFLAGKVLLPPRGADLPTAPLAAPLAPGAVAPQASAPSAVPSDPSEAVLGPFSDLGAALELSLRAREAELWTKLKAEVGSEAKTLGSQGLSPAQVASRLSTFEDDKTASLQATLAANHHMADAAKTALMKLSEKGLSATPLESSLSELFAGLRLSLARGDYAEAQVKARNLQASLAEPGPTPGLGEDREAYLFAADALAGLAVYQLQASLGDASLLLSQAQALEAAKSAASEASRAAAAGNFSQAERAYSKSLALIPSALEAHRYFLARKDAAEELRRRNLTASISRGAKAYDRGEFATSRASYLEALGYLPLGGKDRNRFLENMEATARRLDARSRQVSQTKAAQEAFGKAKTSLAEGRYEEAYAGFVAILSKLPASAQAEESVDGANAAMQGLVQASSSAAADGAKEAEALQARVEELSRDLEAQKTAEAAARHQEEDATAALASLKAEKDQAIAELQAKIEELEKSTLAALGNGAETLKKSYADYCARQDEIVAKGGSAGAEEAYANLASFLDASPFEGILPGYGQRLKKDLDLIRSAAVQADLGPETDISLALLKLSGLESGSEDKTTGLADLRERYKDAPRLLAFVDGLAKGLGLGGTAP